MPRRALVLTTLLATLLSGCSVPHPYVPGAKYPSNSSYASGHAYCREVESGARNVSTVELTAGVLLGFAAAGAMASATVLSSGDAITSNERGFIIGLPVLAAALGVGSGLALVRSKHASELAAAAARASSDNPELDGGDAAKACTAGLAAWNDGRSAAAAAVQTQLDDLRSNAEGADETEADEAQTTEPEESDPSTPVTHDPDGPREAPESPEGREPNLALRLSMRADSAGSSALTPEAAAWSRTPSAAR